MKGTILDAGPIIALLNRRDAHHRWARETLDGLEPPAQTCEAVLSEACFVLRAVHGGADAVLALVERGVIDISFRLEPELAAVRKLMARYADVPMALADACIVRMSELTPRSTVVTLDEDFRIYRRSGRRAIPVILPG